MPSFVHLSHRAHALFKDAKCRVTLGQTQEIISSGLGHKTYASFRQQDSDAFLHCTHALVDFDRMVTRATSLGVSLTFETCRSVFHTLTVGRNAVTRLTPLGLFSLVVNVAFTDHPHPIKDQLAAQLQGQKQNVQCTELRSIGGLESEQLQWTWRVKGSLHISCENDDLAVPLSGEISYPKLGRHLLGEPLITMKADGPAVSFDYEETYDYSYLSDSD